MAYLYNQTLTITYKNASNVTVGNATITFDVETTDTAYRYRYSKVSITNTSAERQRLVYAVHAGAQYVTGSGSVGTYVEAGQTEMWSRTSSTWYSVDRAAAPVVGMRLVGKVYGASGTSEASTSVPARASWTITYDANGGTGGPTTQSKTNGAALTLTTSKPTRAGYAFSEWNTAADHGGTTYMPGGSYATDADVTLYAIWDPVITYYPNGGSGSAQTQQKPVRTAATLKGATTFTRAGHAFDAWNTAANGSGTRYAAGASYSTNAPLALYAQWLKEPNPPTIAALSVVRVDANGDDDDEGLYGKVTVTWSVDLTSQTVGSANRGTLLGAYVASSDTSQATSLAWTGTWQDATGGTATATFLASLDEQYLVLVTVTDARNTSNKADVLTRAQFVMDFRKGGKAIGIGSAAPQDGLLIGWDTEMLGDINGGGKLSLRNPLINRDNPGSSTVWDTTHCFELCDADGERIGLVRNVQTSSGQITTTILALNETTDGTEVSNYININVKRDGTKTFDIGDAAAFRSTLGLARVTQVITASSGIAAGTVALYANATMAQVNVNGLRLSASLASGFSIVIGTVPSGYKPPLSVFGMTAPTSTKVGGLPLKIWIDTNGNITLQNYTGTAVATTQVIEATITYVL